MKALVFGRTGQLATELQRRGPAHGIAIEALGRTLNLDLKNSIVTNSVLLAITTFLAISLTIELIS